VTYHIGGAVQAEEVATLYRRAGLKRPGDDLARIGRMIAGANLIVTARDGDKLVGIARSVTDFSYCCYLSDLAVDPDYQRAGIGKELVRRTREACGDEVMILLLSVPTAMEYYPRIGFQKDDRAFAIPRKK
jgi:GNAT superfamily N-acetyltransferase